MTLFTSDTKTRTLEIDYNENPEIVFAEEADSDEITQMFYSEQAQASDEKAPYERISYERATVDSTADERASDNREAHLKSGMCYLTASLVIAAAAAVYGLFSHGVYSYYMTYAFMIPLLGGAMPHLITALKKGSILDKILKEKDAQFAIIATLTAGSLLKGALDIYGTTNKLLIAYPVLAVLILAVLAIQASRRSLQGSRRQYR